MKKIVKHISKNKFFRGGIFLTAASFISGFLNYLFNSLSGKVLGPSGYSEIAALFSYGILFLIQVQVIGIDLIRRIGEKGVDRANFVKAWDSWFMAKIKRWWWLFIPYFLQTLILPKITNLSPVFSFTLLTTTLLTFLSAFYLAALQGLHLFFVFSMIGIAATLIKLMGPVLVFFKVDGLYTVAFFLIMSSFSTVLLGKLYLNRLYKNVSISGIKVEKKLRQLFLNRWIIITTFSLLGINLLNNLDVIFVKKFFTSEVSGGYGAWSLFARIVFYVLGPIVGMSYVFFSSHEQQEKHQRGLFIFLGLTVLAGMLMYILYSYFGAPIIKLIFTDKFLTILPYLNLAAIFGTLYTLIFILNGYFMAKKSVFSLTVIIVVPVYWVFLYILGKNLETIIFINIIAAVVIFCLYLFSVKLRLGD